MANLFRVIMGFGFLILLIGLIALVQMVGLRSKVSTDPFSSGINPSLPAGIEYLERATAKEALATAVIPVGLITLGLGSIGLVLVQIRDRLSIPTDSND